MELPESRSDVDRQAQEVVRLQGRAEQPLERLPAGILEHQHGPAAFSDKLKRTRRPRPVQLLLQSIFVSKTIQDGRRGMLCSRQHGQHGAVSVGVATDPAEDAFAVLPQDLEVGIPICEQSRSNQLPHSNVERLTKAGRERPYDNSPPGWSHRALIMASLPHIMMNDNFRSSCKAAKWLTLTRQSD